MTAGTVPGGTALAGPFQSDREVEAIGLRLIDRILPKAEWTHTAHLAAAAWSIVARPDLNPARDMPRIIRAYKALSQHPCHQGPFLVGP